MAYVARLVGMELRAYEKDGQKRQFCGLHLMYLSTPTGKCHFSPEWNAIY